MEKDWKDTISQVLPVFPHLLLNAHHAVFAVDDLRALRQQPVRQRRGAVVRVGGGQVGGRLQDAERAGAQVSRDFRY